MSQLDDPTIDPLLTGAVTAGEGLSSGSGHAATRGQRGTGAPPHRFGPGDVIAGRYRVVALLGRGGMGEVYRAEDLTLANPVALKFLPVADVADPSRLARFHNELRIARQVSHKNVCRLYDLGESDGHRFLTMEYVDGEDLSSLLRRIGRLPHDKAVQIARQLCAGLSAAHERGVLHRDLKPANVMIDGEGNVRITDFGIATSSADTATDFAGTPQYMAPEQLTGGAASVRSDIYALGLTLFELFTGRRAHESATLESLREHHRTGTQVTPSSIVKDLDPSVERVILRCLDRDPAKRPESALAVASSLPGADPLADALAAGETPSPTLLAAAAETDALPVVPALAMLVAAIAGMLILAGWSSRVSITGRTTLDRPRDVLLDRARDIVTSLGYDEAHGDEASQFVTNGDYVSWVQRTRPTPDRWDRLATDYPSAVRFWYRTSPRAMSPLEGPAVSRDDPPLVFSDMRLVVLDARGRLLEFRTVPPQVGETGEEIAPSPRWEALFKAAGLDLAGFPSVAPSWVPPVYADERFAWEGPMPDDPEQMLRIEAASLRGRPVSFVVVAPWTSPDRMFPRQLADLDLVLGAAIAAIGITFLIAGVVLARRHVLAGRSDVAGATRLVFVLGVPMLAAWALAAHHSGTIQQEFTSAYRAATRTIFMSVLLWAIYVALEPYVRRFWPHSLLGWSRMLAGHVRDPRVGRDVLAGVVFGVALTLLDVARATVLPWLGFRAPRPAFATNVSVFSGAGSLAASWIDAGVSAVQFSLLAILIIVVLRLVLRWNWLALVVTSVFLSVATWTYMTSSAYWMWVFAVASGALLTVVAVRFGLLTMVVAWFVWTVLYSVPLTLDVSHWSATASNWTIGLVALLAAYAFRAARGRQPIFGRVLQG